MKVFGPDVNANETNADAILGVLSNVPGVRDLGLFRSLGQPSVRITPDRKACARYGLNTGDVTAVIQTAIGGEAVTQVYEGEKHFDLTIRWLPPYRQSVEALREITVTAPNGMQVALGQIAAFDLSDGPATIYRENGQRYAPVKFSVRGRDLASTVGEAQEKVASQVPVPYESPLEWSGEMNELRDVVGRLRVIIPVTLLLIAFLAYTAVGTWLDTLIVLFNVPVACTGGILALLLTGSNFSVSADVLPVRLAEPDILYGTLCVNVLANVWKPRRAATVLRDADLLYADQRAHGMNLVSLRSSPVERYEAGHPYVPDVDAAMELYHRYGFSQPLVYCAGPLLKTEKINRSNRYTEYDPAIAVPLAADLTRYYTGLFAEQGLPGIVFMPIEEPNLKSGIDVRDPADVRQRLGVDLMRTVKDAGGTTALTCTPESIRPFGDLVDYWIVAYKRFTPALYAHARAAKAHLCMYANATVMGQGTYFSRFMFGYFVWANHLDGMLLWTSPIQPKRCPQNLGGRGEGGLHVTDGFLGTDGRPIPTIQWELSREGIDDVRYLTTIEVLARAARAQGSEQALAAAAEADAFLANVHAAVGNDPHRYEFENAQTCEPEPVDDWDARKFDEVKRRAAAMIRQLIAVVPAGRIGFPPSRE